MSVVCMSRREMLFAYNDLDEQGMEMAALSELDRAALGFARCCVCSREVSQDMVMTIHSETGDIFCMCKEHVRDRDLIEYSELLVGL